MPVSTFLRGPFLPVCTCCQVSVSQSRVPNRASPKTGEVIQAYLAKEEEMPDKAIHLLFSFNRWEQR
jgi:thymidylate kinase